MIKTIVLLLVSLTAIFISLRNLFLNKNTGFGKFLDWFLFFMGMTGLTTCWFYFFFPYTRFWGTPDLSGEEIRNLLWGHICVASWGMLAFFVYIYKENHQKGLRFISLMMILLWMPMIWAMTVMTMNMSPIEASAKKVPTIHKEILPTENIPVEKHTLSETTYMPIGGSLCGTLGMTRDEALSFAKKNGLRYWYKNQKLIVLVHPNDGFQEVDGVWEICP